MKQNQSFTTNQKRTSNLAPNQLHHNTHNPREAIDLVTNIVDLASKFVDLVGKAPSEPLQ